MVTLMIFSTEKHPLGKRKVMQAKPSGTETVNPGRAVETQAQPAAKESNPMQSAQLDISTAARLLQAKRQHQQKNQ
jgi:hypothetical protein